MNSHTIGMISRKLAVHFTDERIDNSDIENLIISSILDGTRPRYKETYFTCCKLLVKILNHYISTQDKFVRIFQEGSYAVLVETDYGWKHIEVKREGYEDSKYVIDHFPIDLPLRFVLDHDLDTLTYSLELYRKSSRPKVNREYLRDGLVGFFCKAITHDVETNNYDTDFCKFGSYRNLNFDDAREFLIDEVKKNPFNNFVYTPIFSEIYNSVKFKLADFESKVRQIKFIDSSANADYKNFIKKVGFEVLNYKSLFMPLDTYAHVESVLLSMDTDIEEIPFDMLLNNERYSVGIIEYVLKELGVDDINDYSVLGSFRKYCSLVESISRLLGNDFKRKHIILITALKSLPFSGMHYDVDNFQYNAIKEIVSNKSYNILDTEFLPIFIPIDKYKYAQKLMSINQTTNRISLSIMKSLSIPNKARLKKAKNIDIKLNLLLGI